MDSNSLATSTPCAVDSLTLRAPRFKTLDTSDTLDTLSRVTLEVSPRPLVASPTAGEPRTGDATPSAVPNVAHSTLSNALPPSDDDPPRSDSSSSIFEKAAAIDSFALLPDSAEAVLAAFTRLRRLPHIAWPFVLTGVRLSILRLLGVDAVELGAGDEGDLVLSGETRIEAAFDPNETDRPIGQTEVALRQRLVADRVRSEQLIDGGGSSAEPQARPARVPSFSELEQRAAATPDGEDEDRCLPIHELGDGSGSR